jgi:hypothetical protein
VPHPSGAGVGTLVLYCAQEIETLLRPGREEIGEGGSGRIEKRMARQIRRLAGPPDGKTAGSLRRQQSQKPHAQNGKVRYSAESLIEEPESAWSARFHLGVIAWSGAAGRSRIAQSLLAHRASPLASYPCFVASLILSCRPVSVVSLRVRYS